MQKKNDKNYDHSLAFLVLMAAYISHLCFVRTVVLNTIDIADTKRPKSDGADSNMIDSTVL